MVEEADPAIAESLEAVWNQVHLPNLKINQAQAMVKIMSEGGFIICRDKAAGPGVYTLVVNNGDGTTDSFKCPNSPLGYYLKYSELVGATIKELVLCALANEKAGMAAGVKVALRVPDQGELQRAAAIGVAGGGGGGGAAAPGPALPPPRGSFKGGGGDAPPPLPPKTTPGGGGDEEDDDDTYG